MTMQTPAHLLPNTVEQFVRETAQTYAPIVERPDIDRTVLRALGLPDDFCGNVQFNFMRGGASNVNVAWSEKLR